MSLTFWALALDLSRQEEPKILKAEEFYRFKEGRKCVRFRPKSSSLTDRNEEFGLIVQSDDNQKKIVKHHIIALSDDCDELRKVLTGKPRRVVPPNRLSMSPVIESVDSYSFPEDERADKKRIKRVKTTQEEAVKEAKSKDGRKIMETFEKLQGSKGERKVAGTLSLAKVFTSDKSGDAESVATNEERSDCKDEMMLSTLLSSDFPDETVANIDCIDKASEDEGNVKKKEKKGMPVEKKHKIEGKKPKKKRKKSKEQEDVKRGKKKDQDQKQEVKHDKIEGKQCTQEVQNGKMIDAKEKKEKEVVEHEETFMKRPHKGLPVCENGEHGRLQEKLFEANLTITKQQAEIEHLKNAAKKKDDEQNVLAELKNLISSSSQHSGTVKRTKLSKLGELPPNLLSDDEEVVESPDKIKVGSAPRYIKRSKLEDLEKSPYFTARVESLVDLFYGTKAYKHSVKKGSRHAVTPDEIASMEKILSKMKWSYSCNVTTAKIKTRIIKYLSQCRTAKKSSKSRVLSTKQSSKTFNMKSIQGSKRSESEESVEEVPKKSQSSAARKPMSSSSSSSDDSLSLSCADDSDSSRSNKSQSDSSSESD